MVTMNKNTVRKWKALKREGMGGDNAKESHDDRFLLQSPDPWRKGCIHPESIAIHKSMGPALKSNLPEHQPTLFNH